MVLSVSFGGSPPQLQGRKVGRWSEHRPHPPVHVQDAVGIAVHHMDEQLCLCEVHPALLVHMELGEKGHHGL